MTNAERSAIMRERVLDELGRLGANRSPAANATARRTFVQRAIRVGRERGMRLWADTNMPMVDSAMSSLTYLLGERVSCSKGVTRTGVNSSWVLDLWDAAISDLARYTPKPKHRPVDPATEQIAPVVDGIAVFTEDATHARGLGMKIIQAYLDGDEGMILELAAQVDAIEKEAS